MSERDGGDGRFPLRATAEIKGHASGSQPVLIVLSIGSLFLIFAGMGVASFINVPIGLLGMAFGGAGGFGVFRMWRGAQRDVDGAAGHASEIIVSGDGAIRVSGPASLVLKRGVFQTIAKLTSRLAHQVPLPPAAGLVASDNPTTVAKRFTHEEAEADAKALEAQMASEQAEVMGLIRDATASGARLEQPKDPLPPMLDQGSLAERRAANKGEEE